MKNQKENTVDVIDWAVNDAPLAQDCSSTAGLAAAIGNFDGVHRGHQQVVAAATEAAQMVPTRQEKRQRKERKVVTPRHLPRTASRWTTRMCDDSEAVTDSRRVSTRWCALKKRWRRAYQVPGPFVCLPAACHARTTKHTHLEKSRNCTRGSRSAWLDYCCCCCYCT